MTHARRLWRLLLPADRRAAIVLAGLTLVGMALETLGVGAIVPALAFLTGGAGAPAIVGHLPWLQGLPARRLVAAAMGALVGIYVAKAAFLGVLALRQARFAFAVQANVSQRLFIGYLRQPWTFHLERNSAQLLRNATTEVSNLSNVVQAFITISTEGSVLAGLTALLLFVEPIGAGAVVVILGLAAWSFHRATRGQLLKWGEARQHHDGLRIQHLQQGLGGVKDAKMLGREADFLAQYQAHNDGTARMGRRQFTLQQLPRLWLELLAVAGLASLVLIMLRRGRPIESLLPTLALFAAAAFRLMPSVIRLMNSVQLIRYNLPVIDTLHDELALLEHPVAETAPRPLVFREEIAIEHVGFTYPTGAAPALDDINLTIRRGSSVGFMGGSGAGKSTLVDVILGLLTPSAGRVLVDGVDIQSNLRGWQNQIGYVPQSIYLTDDTLRRNVAFGLADDQIDNGAVRRALAAARLDDFVATLPAGVETTVGERGVQLSGGQRQRVGIARALYHDPAVIVMDEATSALDTATEQGVMDAVKALRRQKTFLIVAHRQSTVEQCDIVFAIERGRLIGGSGPRTANTGM